MQLLVSVRSADEVEPALAGGADIIDAKEPANGSLGAVSSATLSGGGFASPGVTQELSVALGTSDPIAEVIASIDRVELPSRSAPTYLKLGFAGVASPETACKLLGTAVERASRHPISRHDRRCGLRRCRTSGGVAGRGRSSRSAMAARAGGVLIDTHLKDGTRLLDWMDP